MNENTWMKYKLKMELTPFAKELTRFNTKINTSIHVSKMYITRVPKLNTKSIHIKNKLHILQNLQSPQNELIVLSSFFFFVKR